MKTETFSPNHEAPLLVIDLRDPAQVNMLAGWGGATLARVRMIDEDGRATTIFLSARVSGDRRAGSQKGAHFRMSIAKRGGDTSVERRARGWFVLDPSEMPKAKRARKGGKPVTK